MRNHSIVKPGTSTVRYRLGEDSGSSVSSVPRENLNVQGVYSVDGDKKSPNDHRYSVFQWTDFEGIDGLYVSRTDGKTDFVITEGVVGTNASDLHFAFPLMDETQILNSALSDVYEQVRGNLDLSIDIAEFRSTQKMLSYSKQIEQFARRLPPAKIASGLWLQAQYGWLPLAGSIYSGCDEMFRQQTNNWARLRSRSSDQEAFTTSVRQSDGTVNKYTILNDAKVEFKLGYHLGGFQLQNWTSLNPASIAWELLPFSFVVDWIYNVGDYVRSMETALLSGKRFTGGYVTIVRGQQIHVERKFNGRRPGSPKNYRAVLNAVGSGRRIEYSRTVLTAPPIPRPPVLKVDLGWRRLLSGAALLEQLTPDSRGPRQRRGSTS